MDRIRLVAIATLTTAGAVAAQANVYRDVISRTAAMVRNPEARRLAAQHGLRILNLTWEDTGRFKNSTVGPNISDMTIQVQRMDPRSERCFLTCMPVIRFPNFSDKTGDVPIDRFFVLVGNERDRPLRRVSLSTLLGDLRSYLTRPDSWKGRRTSLLAKRDTHVLVSAQACFLPIAADGTAQFNPVLFNYQSSTGNPAVLTILATREGTSITVIDNKRDAFRAGRTWGQRLFFNTCGRRASLTGRRLSDFIGRREPIEPGVKRAASLSMVLLIQVPLVHRPRPRPLTTDPFDKLLAGAPESKAARDRSDVESAVIGHGRVEGPFVELAGLPIKRDTRFPIRVTVQFYKATSNGIVSEADMAAIAAQIRRVYRDADWVGSLVTEGETGRPTEHSGPKIEPPNWWPEFWADNQANTGLTQQQALRLLRRLLGEKWYEKPWAELAKALKDH